MLTEEEGPTDAFVEKVSEKVRDWLYYHIDVYKRQEQLPSRQMMVAYNESLPVSQAARQFMDCLLYTSGSLLPDRWQRRRKAQSLWDGCVSHS